MPRGLMELLAKNHGVSVSVVEAYWKQCKGAIHPVEDGRKKGEAGYGVVVNCVKAKLRKRK